jgi:hypothetical protein
MRRPPFTPRKIPGTRFCWRLSRPEALVRLEALGQLKNKMTLNPRPSGLQHRAPPPPPEKGNTKWKLWAAITALHAVRWVGITWGDIFQGTTASEMEQDDEWEEDTGLSEETGSYPLVIQDGLCWSDG